MTRQVVKEVVALKSSIQDVARKLDDSLISVSCLQVANKESMSGRDRDLITQGLQNILFHLNDLK